MGSIILFVIDAIGMTILLCLIFTCMKETKLGWYYKLFIPVSICLLIKKHFIRNIGGNADKYINYAIAGYIISGLALYTIQLLINIIFYTKKTSSIRKYNKIKNLPCCKKAVLLPSHLEDMQVYEFYGKTYGGFSGMRALILLKCNYDEETFEKEVLRISSMKEIEYNEVTYVYPAYSVDTDDLRIRHYALIDSDNKTITYTFLKRIDEEEIKDIENIKKDIANQIEDNRTNDSKEYRSIPVSDKYIVLKEEIKDNKCKSLLANWECLEDVKQHYVIIEADLPSNINNDCDVFVVISS